MIFFICIQILNSIDHFVSPHGDHDQTLCSNGTDLVLHCLSMSYKKEARFMWVKLGKDQVGVLLLFFSKIKPCHGTIRDDWPTQSTANKIHLNTDTYLT